MRLFRKAALWIARSLSLTSREGWVPSGDASSAGELVTPDSALNLSAVWACVNLLAGTQASLPLVVYRETNGIKAPDKNHAAYGVLHERPNADQTAVDFIEFLCISLELRGNAYARIVRRATDRGLVALIPISPDGVSARRLQTGDLEYRWTQDGESFVALQDDILHIRGFGGGPLGGLSTLAYARETFGLAIAANRAAAKMFANGMSPSGVLTFQSWLSKEQREIANTKIAEQFIGARNFGKPLVLEGGSTWTPIQISPEDAQMLQSRAFSIEDICRFFGVPPFMIGHTEKTTSWGTGLEQQVLAFQKFSLGRRIRRIEQAINKQVLSPPDRANGVSVEFNIEGLLRADSNARAGFYERMSRIGAMTINEIRAKENLPPVEGGDLPRIQAQNIPIIAGPAAPDGGAPNANP